jgi:ArsR family metal-binding transcriptional regulator
VRIPSGIFNLVLTILSIIVILFSSGFYIVNRISDIEKAVEVECQLRSRLEIQIREMNNKIDKVLERLPEKGH